MFDLGVAAGRAGGTSAIAFNAANEASVCAFLKERLAFTEMPGLVERVLERFAPETVPDLRTALECDREARAYAEHLIAEVGG